MTRKKTLWAWSLSALWALTDVALRVVLELDSGPPLHPPLGHRRGYCTPRPPPELHHQQSQRRRNPSPTSRSSSSSSDLLLLVTQVKVDHRPANFWARGWRREGRGQAVYFRCIRSGTFKGRCDFGVNKYRRASNPSKVREACTSSVLPTTRQTRTKASQRRVERGREIAKDLLRRGKSQLVVQPK